MKTRTWHCGNGHTFKFGNEDWHYDEMVNNGVLDDGAPIPSYCTEDFTSDDEDDSIGQYEGEPCLDSSSLIYD